MSFSVSEYTKIDVGWGFATDCTGGAYSAPPDPSWFQGGRLAAGRDWRGEDGRTRGGERRKRRGGE